MESCPIEKHGVLTNGRLGGLDQWKTWGVSTNEKLAVLANGKTAVLMNGKTRVLKNRLKLGAGSTFFFLLCACYVGGRFFCRESRPRLPAVS